MFFKYQGIQYNKTSLHTKFQDNILKNKNLIQHFSLVGPYGRVGVGGGDCEKL